MKKKCSVTLCGRTAACKGYCDAHYRKWRKYGDPTTIKIAPAGAAEDWINHHIDSNGGECLWWPFSLDAWGYGVGNCLGEKRANRAMCRAAHGPPPSPKHEAAHSCGFRSCVNPRHLRWATPFENSCDKLIHGTHGKGENNPRAKLTEGDIKFIRSGVLKRLEIMEKFSISKSQACKIIKGDAWGHI